MGALTFVLFRQEVAYLIFLAVAGLYANKNMVLAHAVHYGLNAVQYSWYAL